MRGGRRAWAWKAIEDWQPAFEAAGFKNAIVAKDAPTPEQDPDWDAEDVRYSSIRWLPSVTENAYGPHIARYVKERVWHASQQTHESEDGALTLTLNVCNDWALRSWVLGFGPLARVISPPALAAQILDEINRTRSQYVPGLDFGLPAAE